METGTLYIFYIVTKPDKNIHRIETFGDSQAKALLDAGKQIPQEEEVDRVFLERPVELNGGDNPFGNPSSSMR